MVKDKGLKYLLGLCEVEGLRGKKLRDLKEQGLSFDQVWRASSSQLNKWGISGQVLDRLRAYKRETDLDKNIVRYQKQKIDLLPFWSDDYPSLLKQTDSFPLLLFIKGEKKILQKPMVAVVGSRRASGKANEKTAAVVGALLKRGLVIVSGLARGVDGYAHKACLGQGGKTVAVLAHGLERVYPVEHQGLAEKIVKGGGALVSEQPLGAKIKREYFLERNRIMVGMSQGLVVVEAQRRSGSLASANRAASMGREVWAVAGTLGTDLLIEEGAGKLKVEI